MSKIVEGVSAAANSLGELSDSMGELVASKKQFITKQVTNVILLLIILVVFGCFDFLHLTFHAEYLIDPNYWINVLVKVVADICAYNIGVNFIIDDIIKRNSRLKRLVVEYENLNNNRQEDFDEFIDIYNVRERIKAYKSKINHKIYMLTKFSRRRDRLLYTNKKVSAEEKIKNRYCRKRDELERIKTDEFIQENLNALDVKFNDVSAAVFDTELNGAEKVVRNQVTGSINKGRAIASASTMLGVIVFSVVLESVRLAPSQEEFENQMVAAAHYAAKISSDIAIIVWQFIRGVMGTHKIVSMQMTNPLAVRVDILKEYYEWRKENGKFVPQCYIDLLKEKKSTIKDMNPTPQAETKPNEEEVEITADEFQQFKEWKEQQKKES